MPDQPRMTWNDWGLLILLSVLWGGSFFFAKVVVQEIPPFTLVLVRFARAAAALGVYLAITECRCPGRFQPGSPSLGWARSTT